MAEDLEALSLRAVNRGSSELCIQLAARALAAASVVRDHEADAGYSARAAADLETVINNRRAEYPDRESPRLDEVVGASYRLSECAKAALSIIRDDAVDDNRRVFGEHAIALANHALLAA